jgi:hypothetical protein
MKTFGGVGFTKQKELQPISLMMFHNLQRRKNKPHGPPLIIFSTMECFTKYLTLFKKDFIKT